MQYKGNIWNNYKRRIRNFMIFRLMKGILEPVLFILKRGNQYQTRYTHCLLSETAEHYTDDTLSYLRNEMIYRQSSTKKRGHCNYVKKAKNIFLCPKPWAVNLLMYQFQDQLIYCSFQSKQIGSINILSICLDLIKISFFFDNPNAN